MLQLHKLTTSPPVVILRDMISVNMYACSEVKTCVPGIQIWLQERIAEILTSSVLVIFSSLIRVYLSQS